MLYFLFAAQLTLRDAPVGGQRQFRPPQFSDQRVEPIPESEYSAPLRFQLADFAPRDNFVWVDRCYKIASRC
jgi:hypothetical protein